MLTPKKASDGLLKYTPRPGTNYLQIIIVDPWGSNPHIFTHRNHFVCDGLTY